MKAPKNAWIATDVELLRNNPTLWACNLHNLPRRILWYVVSAAVVAALLWFRVPPPLAVMAIPIVGMFALVICLMVAGFIIEEYSEIPNDEYIPTPGYVHARALIMRLAAIAIVFVVPLLMGELLLYKARSMSEAEVIADLNAINVGVKASGIDASLPGPGEELDKLQSIGLLKGSEIKQIVETARKATNDQSLIHKMDATLEKYDLDASLAKLLRLPSDISKRADTATKSALRVLYVKGVLGEGPRGIPTILYLDALMISVFVALTIGIAGRDVFGMAFSLWIAPPAFVMACGFLLFILSLLMAIPMDWMVSALLWAQHHAIHLIVLYLGVLVLVYVVSVARLLARPPTERRMISYNYTLAFPSIPLVAAPILAALQLVPASSWDRVMHASEFISLDNEFRTVSITILIANLIFYMYLRREGERIRALPALTSPQSVTST